MKFLDFVKKNLSSKRSNGWPDSIFEVMGPHGSTMLMCWSDLSFEHLSKIPDIENYIVTKESLTQDEIEARSTNPI